MIPTTLGRQKNVDLSFIAALMYIFKAKGVDQRYNTCLHTQRALHTETQDTISY